MDFEKATPVSCIPVDEGSGGIAVNASGTLFASVDSKQHCVRIYRLECLRECTAVVIVGTASHYGIDPGTFNTPTFACFVRRNCVDTLVICDSGNDRVVEVTSSGEFVRSIAMTKGSWPYGVAYCSTRDFLAVSLHHARAVVLLPYENGAVKPEVTIGLGVLGYPRGVAFTADGLGILVADCYNHCVSKFSTVSGLFILHVATRAANGIRYPVDVQCEDDSIVVTAEDGPATTTIVDNVICGKAWALSYSPSLTAFFFKSFQGNVFIMSDSWIRSSRCAWVSAMSIR